MLSNLNGHQKALLTAYFALADAQPPSKEELRHTLNPRASFSDQKELVVALRGAEHFVANLTRGLFELSKASKKYSTPVKDAHRRGTGLPGHRKVRVS